MITVEISKIRKGNVYICIELWSMSVADTPIPMIAVRNLSGDYIGRLEDYADYKHRFGIETFELRNKNHNTCTLGFSPTQNKWYGWSHRAIFGFTVGSKITKYSSGYTPDTFELFKEEPSICSFLDVRLDGMEMCTELGHTCNEFNCPRYKKGRGEWEAKTLEDARIMAIDFSTSVN